MNLLLFFFFFFSSRRRHTRWNCDWSSDVCSSDLHGFQWHPLIGQEVLVDFLEGDPDRPIIVGSVYNADQMPPYALPNNKTQSGIKSRSSKDASTDNFNEITFEDKKGKEQIFIHA